jgi:2-polyprenyl-3-methyl-5-hydroxy-6-metoxy-1,4-benzoquinol methylase
MQCGINYLNNIYYPAMSSSNINDTYFDGYYKHIWKAVIPDELTVKETDFIISYFNLAEGTKVLDLMCGYGRHALSLAKKGINVTAVDNLQDYISEIQNEAAKGNLPVKPIQHDVCSFKTDELFDLAMCMGNSLNFFDATDTAKVLSTAAAALKKGGQLFINSWSVAEIVFKNFKSKGWDDIAGYKFLTDSKILFHPTRVESESIIIAADGLTETKIAVDYIFSINEMEQMLNEAGFQLKELYSIPGRKQFAIGEPRLYIVAVKL